ncbi:MAG: hypothetical protein CMN30_02595 [Sandaracinus sp.]|nr:hypothetical protein [Sandaracinus sp.]
MEELPEVGTRLSSRYRLDGVLARGGVGVVYQAFDLETSREVAVKVLPRSLDRGAKRERFLREAKVAAQVGHPHVVKVYDFGFYDQARPFLVMELLHGASLHRRIQTVGPLSISEACSMGSQVLSACEAVHAEGLVHRDIKPGNVFLMKALGVTAKLIDFGMSKSVVEDTDPITEPGRILGTPSYMAPELLVGRQPDARTDLYGVGATLFESLLGRPIVRPHKRVEVTFGEVLRRENVRPSTLRPRIPPYVDDIVCRALEREPDDRFADAREMRRACDAALNRAVDEGL